MPTCLDDINATLQALVTALDGGLGGDAITISTEANAVANASAQAYALNSVRLAAISVAYANALSIVSVDIDVSLNQTTTITNVTLPPVSSTTPPNTTVFPEASTGVSATPRTGASAGGDICQAVYMVIDTLQAFVTSLAKYPIWGLDTAYDLLSTILAAVGAVEFFLSLKGWILPKMSLVAIASLLTALMSSNVAVQDLLDSTALWLSTDRDALAEQIWCLFFNGASTLDVVRSVHDAAAQSLGPEAAQLIGALLTPNVLAAMIYESALIDASSIADDCSSFACGP